MSRKRDKPNTIRHIPYTFPKRRRPHPPPPQLEPSPPPQKPTPPPSLLVIGLPPSCSVLDLKSRFEIYGSISRIKIDPHGLGFVSFRTRDSADQAIAASLDPSFGISFDSHRVTVRWASESETGKVENKERMNSSSKLLKGEAPLRRYGKGNRLSSAIVNPNSNNSNNISVSNPPVKPREIIAYDDIL